MLNKRLPIEVCCQFILWLTCTSAQVILVLSTVYARLVVFALFRYLIPLRHILFAFAGVMCPLCLDALLFASHHILFALLSVLCSLVVFAFSWRKSST